MLVCKAGGRQGVNEIWFWGEKILDICSEYKYLGITFSSLGISNVCLNVFNDQAKKSLCSLLMPGSHLSRAPCDKWVYEFSYDI